MKKIILTATLLMSVVAFAQKDELKAARKAIKSQDFAAAKTALKAAEPMMASASDSEKNDYYYYKAMSAYGTGNPQGPALQETIDAFNAYLEFSKTSGEDEYKKEIIKLQGELRGKMVNSSLEAYNAGNYVVAADGFGQLYELDKDTVFLFYSAASALNAKEYPRALEGYKKLMELGYTGIKEQYVATNKETGEEETFDSKNLRDIQVKSGEFENPVNKKTESQRPQIVSTVALLYTQENKIDEAIATIQEARKLNPEEVELIKTEANLYIKKEDNQNALRVMNEAIAKQPNNHELYYVAGLLQRDLGNMEKAEETLKKAVELKPDYVDAIESIADLYISKGNLINDQMNALGNTKADNIKYDELKAEKAKLYQVAADWLEKSVAINPDKIQTLEVLKNIYGSLDNMERFKQLKEKIESLSN